MTGNLSPHKRALLKKWLQGDLLQDHPTTIQKRPANSPVVLSFPQRRQIFLELLERNTAVNNLSRLLEIKGRLDIAALQKSVDQILTRHETLRSSFSFGTDLPTCQIADELKISIPMVDLQQGSIDEQMLELQRLTGKEVLQPFDLTKPPLISLKLYVFNPETYFLLVVVNHTIADGWSLGVFLKELMLFYKHHTTGNINELPDLPIQYADFAYWQTTVQLKEVMQSSMTYWKNQLNGELPVLELPVDYQRQAKQSFSGGTYRFELSQSLSLAFENLCRKEDVTPFMALLTVYCIMLYRYSGQEEILVGTPVANRNLPELESMIGIFINTLVLRVNLTGNLSFRELLGQVRDVALGAFAHQDMPFEKLVEALKPTRNLSRTPLFQTVFNLQNSPLPDLKIPGLEINFQDIDRGVSQFDLTLIMSKSDGKYHGTVEYNDDLFKPATIQRIFQSFQMLMDNIVENPDCLISRLPIVSKVEYQKLVYQLNNSDFEFSRHKCVHQLFEEQAAKTPDAIAIIHNNNQITYSELNQLADALAGHLQALNLRPGFHAGILMEKSIKTVVAMMGVLKAGGVYVPLQSSLPKQRVQSILENAEVKVLLTDTASELADQFNGLVINLNGEELLIKDEEEQPSTAVSPNDAAYIIYTSGSTGQPKGVMVHHAAIVNFLLSMRKRPGIKENDVLLSVTSISFDIVVLEIFLPLTNGATMVIGDQKMINNPQLIGEAIEQHQVNIMQATPAFWHLLIASGWKGNPALKALCGGDALSPELAHQILDRTGSLWNMYGPTETTIWSSVSQVNKGDTVITIGKPIDNTQLYVLDRYLQPVPVGVKGELHIGGEGLAMGYFNRPDLTLEKFIPDPFTSRPAGRLYKTGDLARYLPDYSIELLGRMDDQVKIQGYRIELGEIISMLLQHPTVKDCTVIARKEKCGEQQLLAYFISRNETIPQSGELRDFLAKKLPAYMIPSYFIRLETLPLTASGKIDRKSLPLPEQVRQLSGYVAPKNEEEEVLAEIWQEVLGIERIGVHDDFFDLGGASMQSIQIVAKANMFGLEIYVENIFQYQTIAELAGFLREKNNSNT